MVVKRIVSDVTDESGGNGVGAKRGSGCSSEVSDRERCVEVNSGSVNEG